MSSDNQKLSETLRFIAELKATKAAAVQVPVKKAPAENVLKDYFAKCDTIKPLYGGKPTFMRAVHKSVEQAVKKPHAPMSVQTIARYYPDLYEIVKSSVVMLQYLREVNPKEVM
jgi:hypothetical protein